MMRMSASLKSKIITCICIFLFVNFHLKAQEYKGREAAEQLQNAKLLRVNPSSGKISYALLDENFAPPQNQALAYLKKALKLSDQYSLYLFNSETDELGFEHQRFQLKYQSVPVYGAIVIAHFKNHKLHSFNGEVYEINADLATNPLSEELCLTLALKSLPATSYKWQVEEEEAAIKTIKNNAEASWFPKGELVYCPLNLSYEKPVFKLSYKFSVYANEPLLAENIFIDVSDGTVNARENLIHTTDVPATAYTKYSGIKSMVTDSTASFNYRLREAGRGGGIYTLNMKKGTSYGAAVDFTDSNNIWNNVNANKDEVATDAHWGAEVTFDYFKSIHNRNSYDNKNARIYSYVHYSSNYDNAFWNGVAMTYGDGNTFKPLTSIDVCGHEIAHAVTSNTANLIYSYESGALNESFSDIFGNTIERYGRPTQYNWKIGEEITTSGSGLRDMANPKVKGHPRCYKSTNWYTGTGDNGGVHINSGVQNWWYYLITEGGAGTNDASNVYKVDSLGITKAEKIAYRNLSVYLGPSSNYADARFYSIRSAVDLYGECGKEVIAVTNAWYACNVGAKYDSGYVKAGFAADTIVCRTGMTANFYNLSSNAKSVKWYFGDGASSTAYSPTYQYKNYGVYSVKLVANSCFKNKSDSLTRTAYIKVDSSFDICNSVRMPESGTDSTSKCQSFVYDDGGEAIYKQARNTFLKISVPASDSIVFNFLDFDYENKYDSLYIYRGKYPGGTLLGSFTGTTLPFAGKKIKVNGSLITLRHRSDQLVTGRGFKMYYTAYKQAVKLTAFKDTTICNGNSVILYGVGKNGYSKDYVFTWKGISHGDSITVKPIINTLYKVYLTDVCTRTVDSSEVRVDVRSKLKVSVDKDTTICVGQSVNLTALATGGLPSAYQYTWDNGLSNKSTHVVLPGVTTRYQVILSDGCSPLNDTASINITVRDPLKVKLLSNDTLICFSKTSALNASGSGGLSSAYTYLWNNGLGTGIPQSISLKTSSWLKVTLSDGCTVIPAKDSILVKVRPELKVFLNNDSAICKGTSVNLTSTVSGGNISNYTYAWNQGLAATPSHNVNPSLSTKYVLTLTDNCSSPAKDSIMVTVLPALKITGLKDTTICYGGSASFKPQISGGKVLQYVFSWDNGLGIMKDQVVSPLVTTSYKIKAKDNCTVFGDSGIVNVTVRPPLKLGYILQKPAICSGDSSQLALNFSGGVPSQYQWFVNGIATSKSIFYLKPSTTSNFKINLTDKCSNKDSALINVVVYSLPFVDFEIDKLKICRNQEVQFTNRSTGAVGYDWRFSPTNQSKVTSPKFMYTKVGVYDVSLTATTAEGCDATLTKPAAVTVIDWPGANFSFTPLEPKLPDPSVNFLNLSSNYIGFKWKFGDGSEDSVNLNPTYKYRDKGQYKVWLYVANELNCKDSMSMDVLVSDIYYLWVPNAFSPNGDGFNDQFKIVSKGILVSEYALFNRWGEKVFESSLDGKVFEGKDMNGKILPQGTYVMELKLRDFTKRFHIVRTTVDIL